LSKNVVRKRREYKNHNYLNVDARYNLYIDSPFVFTLFGTLYVKLDSSTSEVGV
jgi:hypothetical protein